MSSVSTEPITGRVAGVPFVALPPERADRASAPAVVAWHLLDPPRTEAAFAAALPLRGLDAWRIYLGLPLSGSRLPVGGYQELMQRGYQDAVLKLDKPIVYGAAAEFEPALHQLRRELGLRAESIGVMGGSIGAAVAQLVMAEGAVRVDAAVLVSPVISLRRAVEAGERQFGVRYSWSPESTAVADRLDLVARAGELTERGQPAVLVVVGEQDDVAIREPAEELVAVLARYYGRDRSRLVTIAGMAHALAEEPGDDPAPQMAHATIVDRYAVQWFQQHLSAM